MEHLTIDDVIALKFGHHVYSKLINKLIYFYLKLYPEININ